MTADTFLVAVGQSKVFSYNKKGQNGSICATYAKSPGGASRAGSASIPTFYQKITTPYGLRTGVCALQT
jgi:hypothetical protein